MRLRDGARIIEGRSDLVLLSCEEDFLRLRDDSLDSLSSKSNFLADEDLEGGRILDDFIGGVLAPVREVERFEFDGRGEGDTCPSLDVVLDSPLREDPREDGRTIWEPGNNLNNSSSEGFSSSGVEVIAAAR